MDEMSSLYFKKQSIVGYRCIDFILLNPGVASTNID